MQAAAKQLEMPFPPDLERGVWPQRRRTPPSSPNRSPFPSPLKEVLPEPLDIDDKQGGGGPSGSLRGECGSEACATLSG